MSAFVFLTASQIARIKSRDIELIAAWLKALDVEIIEYDGVHYYGFDYPALERNGLGSYREVLSLDEFIQSGRVLVYSLNYGRIRISPLGDVDPNSDDIDVILNAVMIKNFELQDMIGSLEVEFRARDQVIDQLMLERNRLQLEVRDARSTRSHRSAENPNTKALLSLLGSAYKTVERLKGVLTAHGLDEDGNAIASLDTIAATQCREVQAMNKRVKKTLEALNAEEDCEQEVSINCVIREESSPFKDPYFLTRTEFGKLIGVSNVTAFSIAAKNRLRRHWNERLRQFEIEIPREMIEYFKGTVKGMTPNELKFAKAPRDASSMEVCKIPGGAKCADHWRVPEDLLDSWRVHRPQSLEAAE
jgi:hypothetical protein